MRMTADGAKADSQGTSAPARVIAAAGFVHLHVHSSYSLREGAIPIGKLAKLAAADSMPALAITDSNNLFGALEFSEKLAKEGVQPIVGLQLTVDFLETTSAPRSEAHASHASIVLLAMDSSGYANLMHIVSCAWLNPKAGEPPHIGLEGLQGKTEGLIALTGGPNGPLDHAFFHHRPELALGRAASLERLFHDRIYVEVQRHGLDRERAVEPQLLDLAYRRSVP